MLVSNGLRDLTAGFLIPGQLLTRSWSGRSNTSRCRPQKVIAFITEHPTVSLILEHIQMPAQRSVPALRVPASGSQPTPHAVADKASSYPSTLLGAERAYWNRKVRAVSQPRIADEASKSIRCGTAVEAP